MLEITKFFVRDNPVFVYVLTITKPLQSFFESGTEKRHPRVDTLLYKARFETTEVIDFFLTSKTSK